MVLLVLGLKLRRIGRIACIIKGNETKTTVINIFSWEKEIWTLKGLRKSLT